MIWGRFRHRSETSKEGEGLVNFRPLSHHNRARQVPFAINIAPMIDVTFLLLIFFVVTTTFEKAEGLLAAKLPKDQGRPAVALPISPVVVRLKQTGPNMEDFVIRLDNFDGTPTDFEELARMLGEIQHKPGFDVETPVVIVPEGAVRWDQVVNAWNAAVRSKYNNVAFVD